MTIEKHLASMVALDRWCVAYGHADKSPRMPDGTPASSTDPATWSSYAEAQAAADANGWHVGYMFGDGQHWFLDLDRDDAIHHPWVGQFIGAAVERSLGGTGVHVYGTFEGSCPPHSKKRTDLHIEFYSRDRFGIVTGKDLRGSSACPFPMAAFLAENFPPKEHAGADDWTVEPVEDYTGWWDDDELIRRMLTANATASAAFGNTATAAQLWGPDVEALARCYPSPGQDDFDRSTADMALAGKLAFWTGKDCERIERLMRLSGLARDKWEREDYLPDTILEAVANCRGVYDRVETAAPGQAVHRPAEIFDGMIYVSSVNRILTPGGELMKKDAFNNLYADRGPYPLPGSDVTWKGWDSFIRHQPGFPRVYAVMLDATTDEPILTGSDGRRYANTWRGIRTPAVEGDTSVFLSHLGAMYPEQDAEILLAYLAAVVQYPGRKFGWLLVQQGVEGNGKSTITKAVSKLLGLEYVARVRPNQIGGQFNSNLSGKLLAVVDDVDRIQPKAMEVVKTLVTSTELEIERKGEDAVIEPSCVNFIVNTNYIDAIPKTRNDRRICVIKSTMQSSEQVPDRAHFDRLHDSLRDLSALHYFLANYKIPDALDPTAGARRAPESTATAEAIAAGRTRLEQEILEAVGRGDPRFRGGWISSAGVEQLCADLRLNETAQYRKRAVENLGYVPYRDDNYGRATRKVLIDGGQRSRLWVRPDYQGDRTVEAYEAAQEGKPNLKAVAT